MIPAAISTIEVSPTGSILLFLDSGHYDGGTFMRRVNRTATLDGGAFVLDSGYSDADRTVKLNLIQQSKEVIDNVTSLVKFYSTVLLFLPDGAFKATPEQFIVTSSGAILVLLISGQAEVN